MPLAVRARTTPRRHLAIAVALLFAVASVVGLAGPKEANAWDGGSFSSGSERELVRLTNRSRASAGLRSLRLDSTLTAIARWRSKDMIKRHYFGHSIPGYGSVFDKLSAKGYCYRLAGENIGWNTYPDSKATAAIHRMFMDSRGHRKNVLGKRWDRIGIGAYKSSSGKKMWTVIFADRCGGGGGSKSNPKPKSKVERQKADKPKPKPTPRPTPKPTPTPYPLPPAVDPEDFEHRPDVEDALTAAEDPRERTRTAALTSSSGLRVEERSGTPGLLETIVGDVTGAYFGD
jgi:uncharacterized protein YkwD